MIEYLSPIAFFCSACAVVYVAFHALAFVIHSVRFRFDELYRIEFRLCAALRAVNKDLEEYNASLRREMK